MILPVILAGGTGSRLWPKSRAMHPKQFLKILSDNTMLQETLLRLDGIEYLDPLIVCNEEYRFLVAEQIREIKLHCEILLEPEAKNTAPAITLAALHAVETNPDAILLVLAADHQIENIKNFHQSIYQAEQLARQQKLVTFGIVPHKAETGYGYIKRGKPIEAGFLVEEFTEKPQIEKAKEFLQSGRYYWNSGMFMFRAKDLLAEINQYSPETLSLCEQAMEKVTQDLDFVRIQDEAFTRCPSVSIDYAVMEKTKNAVTVPLDAGWNDVGSWAAIWEVTPKDNNGNQLTGDVLVSGSSGCLIQAEDRIVSALGLKDTVIVDTKDALLVAHKDAVQDVKVIVEKLKQSQRTEWQIHREVCRPWGKFDAIDSGHRYQVKRITVNPGAKISVQMHHHRAEHWIVVSGTAKVRKGEQIFLLAENESTYIPIGEIHSLENPGKVPLELIEVQTGAYLGEDDIVRFEDDYGRIK
ncbi:mannose-1-phosphate guanylyltransferase/mannose-6-phosphate isomerase [Aliikangiella maris]|uniref:mannose-1-phosphate guanylyltransferase n=2 Tax=Aliikangiella maris TaxID=3162458 RepID=A0ABV3MI11_9GAMM